MYASILSSSLSYYYNHHINICDGLVNECRLLLFFAPTSPVSSLTSGSETSEDLDQQEIQRALRNAKMAARNKIRSRFHSSSDLIHRLFVCISGLTFSVCIHHSLPPSLRAANDVVPPCSQVLPISYRPTTPATFVASSRLCSKSWRPRLSRGIMTSRRKARTRLLTYSQDSAGGNVDHLEFDSHKKSHRTLFSLFFSLGAQQALFCAVQCWRTVSSVRRPFPHQRWQPRPGRVSSKVRLPTNIPPPRELD